VSDVRRDLSDTHEAPHVKLGQEHDEREPRLYPCYGLKPNQRVGEASTWHLVSIHGRATHQVGALTFVQQNVAELQPIDLVFLGREVHRHDVARVDPILENVRDAEIRAHVRPGVVRGRSLTPELHTPGSVDARPAPTLGQPGQPFDVEWSGFCVSRPPAVVGRRLALGFQLGEFGFLPASAVLGEDSLQQDGGGLVAAALLLGEFGFGRNEAAFDGGLEHGGAGRRRKGADRFRGTSKRAGAAAPSRGGLRQSGSHFATRHRTSTQPSQSESARDGPTN
jgi:hypothetical protein